MNFWSEGLTWLLFMSFHIAFGKKGLLLPQMAKFERRWKMTFMATSLLCKLWCSFWECATKRCGPATLCHSVPHCATWFQPQRRPPPNTKHPKILAQIPGKNNWESLKKKQLAYTLELFILSKTPFFCKLTQGYKNHKPTYYGNQYL